MSIIENNDNQDTLIFDNIHNYIEVDDIARSIIDTPEFQRLRRIHQGGVLYYVFPTANHSRFEHSIGTYHLAKKFINNIKDNQPELNITNNIVKVISVAGLCHDLGHLMYSHLFDDIFLPKLSNYKSLGNVGIHEERSIIILKNIIDKYKINITTDELVVIGDLINPKNNNYANWNDGEPNNAGNEDYAHITDPSIGFEGSWNDLANSAASSGPYQSKGYMVEYGGSPGDPILKFTATTK